MQLLVAVSLSPPPPEWWQAVQLCTSGSSTSLVIELPLAWAWQSAQFMLRWESWLKTLAANHRRPSGVAIGRVVGAPTDAIKVCVAGRVVAPSTAAAIIGLGSM